MLGLCLCCSITVPLAGSTWAASAVSTDREKAIADARSIAAFGNLPSVSASTLSANVFGMKLVILGDQEGVFVAFMSMLAYVMRGSEPDDLVRQLRYGQRGSSAELYDSIVVERRPVSLGGQQTEIVISEGRDLEDHAMRDARVVYLGANGTPTIVSVSTPVSDWQDGTIDAFLASLR